MEILSDCHYWSFMVSTIDSFPIFLIGRRIASAAEPKHKTTISKRDTAGNCQLVPHLPAIRNWNIILFNGSPRTHHSILPCSCRHTGIHTVKDIEHGDQHNDEQEPVNEHRSCIIGTLGFRI